MMAVRTILAGGMAALILAGCGFHLRGNTPLPIIGQDVYFSSKNPYGELEQIITGSLDSAGVARVEKAADAEVSLTINGTSTSRRAVTRDAAGRANEYALTYVVDYTLQAAGEPPVKDQVTSIREYTYDRNANVSQDNEESLLIKDMQRDLANRILQRLSRLKPAEPDPQPATPEPTPEQ